MRQSKGTGLNILTHKMRVDTIFHFLYVCLFYIQVSQPPKRIGKNALITHFLITSVRTSQFFRKYMSSLLRSFSWWNVIRAVKRMWNCKALFPACNWGYSFEVLLNQRKWIHKHSIQFVGKNCLVQFLPSENTKWKCNLVTSPSEKRPSWTVFFFLKNPSMCV